MTKGEGGIVYRPLNWELHQLRLQRDRPVHITVGAAPIRLLSSSSILFFRLHFHHLSVKWLNGTIFLSLRGIYYPAQFHIFLCLRLRYTKSTWVHLECFFLLKWPWLYSHHVCNMLISLLTKAQHRIPYSSVLYEPFIRAKLHSVFYSWHHLCGLTGEVDVQYSGMNTGFDYLISLCF